MDYGFDFAGVPSSGERRFGSVPGISGFAGARGMTGASTGSCLSARSTVSDRTTIMSVPGMVAQRDILSETLSQDAKVAMGFSMYERDAREGFLRRAQDTCPEVPPAGACRPPSRIYAIKKSFFG
mmetsp:Transcript_81440/g.225550  ORF Transcript_81440/g.225550 Transcript_81440/m.225550 type:complete len:125 (-) Transcript_81440:26-400(-)